MSRFLLLSFIACSFIFPSRSPAQDFISAPVERYGFAVLTPYDTLQAFLSGIAHNPRMHLERIATSHEGRAVELARVALPGPGTGPPPLRILLFAQQHGNEPSGKEALTMLLARLASGRLDSLLAGTQILVVPQMNPDGAERRQRRTADSLDLNRSHLLLNSPEVQGLHDLFRKTMPEVTLDIHEFTSTPDSADSAGIEKIVDVQFGMLTNPNASAELRAYQHEHVFPWIAQSMQRAGYLFHEYLVGSPPARLRHSTTEPNDGRQSFGLLGTLSFIQEGRKPDSLTGHLERRARSQLASIESLISFCSRHAADIRRLTHQARALLEHSAGRPFALRMEHVPVDIPMAIPVHLRSTGRDTVWRVTPYHGRVHTLAWTSLPSAYLVRREAAQILAFLERQKISKEIVGTARPVLAERFIIDSVGTDCLEEDTLPRPIVRLQRRMTEMRPGDMLVRMDQLPSLLAATMLEPASMWGLSKYPSFSPLLRQGEYPVLRIP